VYATYAALRLGTLRMLELARMQAADASSPSHAAPPAAPAAGGSAPAAVADFLHGVWRSGMAGYSEAEVAACAARITPVSYGQRVWLAEDGALSVMARPSGLTIGGAARSLGGAALLS